MIIWDGWEWALDGNMDYWTKFLLAFCFDGKFDSIRPRR